MKFGQPLVSTKLSGKLGGLVGATARGGVGYFRRRVDGSNPQTPGQALARSVMATLSGAWLNTLTDTQRTQWASKAKPEESGIDVYIRANFQQVFSGNAASVATPPSSIALGETPITDVGTFDASDLTWTVDVPAGSNIGYNVFVSRPQTASRLSRQYPFVYVPGNDMSPGTVEVQFSNEGPIIGVTAGQVLYIRVVPYGQASPKLGKVGEEQIFRVAVVA